MRRSWTVGTAALVLGLALGLAGPWVVAQSPVPFQHWPALYEVAETLVATQGVDENGEFNGKVYLRLGWGDCLAIARSELRAFPKDMRPGQYTKVREYAAERLDQTSWTAEDEANCPRQPMAVRPAKFGRDSRPTYRYVYNQDLGLWQRGSRSRFRVAATEATAAACNPRWPARNDSGRATSYYRLAAKAEVYEEHNGHIDTHLVENIERDFKYALVAVCDKLDVDVATHRWTP